MFLIKVFGGVPLGADRDPSEIRNPRINAER
jgi:hypothetical protein